MDSKILQLMESANPQDRKQAVKLLAKMGGQEALRYLGLMYKQETDPDIKELTIQAGKYIKKQATASAPPAAASSRYAPMITDEGEIAAPLEVEEEEVYQPQVVPLGKQQQAKGMMDRALDLSMNNDKDKAIDSMAKAFKLNPNLRLDSYYMGVAMDITGLDKDATIRLVTSDEKTRKAKNNQKAKNDGSGGSDEVTWDTALIDLATYFVVVSAIMVVGLLVLVQVFTAAFTTMQACGCNTTSLTSSLSFLESLRGVGIVIIILYSLVVGLLSVGFLLLQYGFIHLLSGMVLGGEGTYRGLIHRATTPINVATGFTGVVSIISLYMLIQPFSDQALMQTYLATGQEPALSSISYVLSLVNGLVALFCLGWISQRIGHNYQFGLGRGCVSLILSYVAFFLVSFGCSFAIANTALSTLPR